MIPDLRDSIWQSIDVVIGFIALLAAIVFYLLQRSRKSLAYQVISNTKILTVNEEYQGKLEIVYEGTPVQNATLCVLKLVNDGNVPIATTDYEQPLSLGFGSACNILSAEIIETSPITLKPQLRIEATRFYLEPLLLNRKDSLTIKLLIAQYDSIVEPDARIIGVREVRKLKDRSLYLVMAVGSFVLIIVALAVIWAMNFWDALGGPDASQTLIVYGVIVLLTTYLLTKLRFSDS